MNDQQREPTSGSIGLTCWHCGATANVAVPHPPRFGFELAGWAADVGMVGYADMRYGRVLIFCDASHARAEMTKTGMFRLRPRGVTHTVLTSPPVSATTARQGEN